MDPEGMHDFAVFSYRIGEIFRNTQGVYVEIRGRRHDKGICSLFLPNHWFIEKAVGMQPGQLISKDGIIGIIQMVVHVRDRRQGVKSPEPGVCILPDIPAFRVQAENIIGIVNPVAGEIQKTCRYLQSCHGLEAGV